MVWTRMCTSLEIFHKPFLSHVPFHLELKRIFKLKLMNLLSLKYFAAMTGSFLLLSSCKKQDEFLNAKPDQALIVPSSLSDYQLLINNESVFNLNGDPALGTITADDDYYVTDDVWAGGAAPERNGYIWAPNFYENDPLYQDWNNPYSQ